MKKDQQIQERKEIPVGAYSKAQMAAFYNVNAQLFHTWLLKWEKELKKLGYDRNQKVFTVAQVRYLFRDDVLGQP